MIRVICAESDSIGVTEGVMVFPGTPYGDVGCAACWALYASVYVLCIDAVVIPVKFAFNLAQSTIVMR